MPSRDDSRAWMRGKSRSKTPVSTAPLKIFISHSSEDRALVKSLIELLKEALGLTSEQIRCTSLPGYGLHAGAPVEDQIRFEVDQAEVLLGVISEASLDSLYVAFELGARWLAGKPLIPLLAPGLDPNNVPEPLRSKHALQCADESQLFQLIENLERYLHLSGKRREKSSVFYTKIKEFCQSGQHRTSPAWYGIQFITPDEGTVIKSRRLAIKGRFEHRPPDGALHIFLASVDWNRWWPVAVPELKHHDRSWSAEMEFEKGYEPYDAWIVITLVSKSSVDLVRYLKKLPRHLELLHTEERRGELEKHKEFDSLFGGIKPDGIEVCDKRKVHVNL